MLVLKGLVGLHRTIQLQLLQRFWLGHRLGLLWYWMICLGNEQRQKHSVVFEISPHWDTTSSRSEKNLQATNAREGEEKRETFYWWECKLLQPLWRTVWRFLKTTKYELSRDPAIPFLGIYLDKTIIQKASCIPMFIAALFTIVKTWKQSECPSAEEGIKTMWYEDFPGGPAAKTPHSQHRGAGFHSWSENWIPHAKLRLNTAK